MTVPCRRGCPAPARLGLAGMLLVACANLMCSQTGDRSAAPPRGADDSWTLLFNGRDLTGWEPAGNARWSVQNGVLVGVQGDNNAPGDLFTTESYGDFVLTVTYRAEWPANSGVWFRYQSENLAYQADILEWKDPVAYSGTVYCPGKMFIARNLNRDLEDRQGWNTLKIQAQGDRIQVWLNGHQTADVRDDGSRTGKIGLQVHPGAEFAPMKIMVKEARLRRL